MFIIIKIANVNSENVLENKYNFSSECHKQNENFLIKMNGLENGNLNLKEQIDVINIVNNARSTVKVNATSMRYVSYNNNVGNMLQTYVNKLKDPRIFFMRTGSGMYGMTIMSDPYFSNYTGWRYLSHDTFGSSVADNFNFRMNKQKNCFNYSNCNNEYFSDFTSCYSGIKGINCNWWWQYYPQYVQDMLTQIACVMLGVRSPIATSSNPNSYFCYGILLNSTNQPMYYELYDFPPSDYPYVNGTSCSKCYPGLKCNPINKLCTS